MTDATQQTTQHAGRLIVRCTDCRFRERVPFEERTPADVVIEHGRETGHTLQVSRE